MFIKENISFFNDQKDIVAPSDFFIGLGLAIVSSLLIGTSFIFKKISLLNLSKTSSLRASAGGFGYLKDWVWWTGFLFMSLGEVLNLIAYGFAPASIVTPLGAFSILVSSVLASKYLQEHLTRSGKIGCIFCIFGSIIIVYHAPKSIEPESLHHLFVDYLQEAPVILYSIFTAISAIILIVIFVPKYGNHNILIYVTICSQVGSFSVMACKVLTLSIREKISNNLEGSQMIFLSFLILLVCVSIQINYLNKALDVFGASLVTPVYYVLFTTLVLLASAILFKEWEKMSMWDLFGTFSGLVICFVAIFMLHDKKEIPNYGSFKSGLNDSLLRNSDFFYRYT